jgi:uncharacterized protein (AIM24 family)
MASSINASTSGAGGVITTADNTGILNIQTAGTTAVTVDASQRVAFVAGTAALPAITTTGDTNTGIFFSAADTIDFAEGGTAVGQFDSSANFKFNSGYGSVATAYGCRAWVNFNGTGTVAIRASGNVSSITDRGNGQYTANFTTAMPDANYTFSGLCANTGSGKAVVTEISLGSTGALFNTAPGLAGAALEDSSVIVISVFR